MDERPHRFDARLPNLKGSIFIVTYGRSGSTFLQSILQSIPGAHICGENNNLMMPIWNAVGKIWGAKNAWADKGGDQPNNPWYGTHNSRPIRFAERSIDAFVDEVLRPPTTARWIGFKEIRYDEYGDKLPNLLDFMSRHFKNPYFVFNTRNADAVARSGWWSQRDPEDVRSMVQQQDARFAAYVKSRPDNTCLVRYEDITTDPETLQPLFDMLGEKFDEAKIRDVQSHRLTH